MDLFIILLLLVLALFYLNEKDKQKLIQSHRCEWCGKIISHEDRHFNNYRIRGFIMCPYCWEETRIAN